ncbi:MAG TPA: pilin [Candidatus Saccharimonadales bacterium]|nr:pilin [Candidatus Saccharimonadales bacterium]
MIQKIRTKLLSLSLLLLMFAPALLLVASVSAQGSGDTGNANIQGSLCGGATDLRFDPTTNTCVGAPDETDFNDLLAKIINIISVIVGVVAVIMIIVGGFRYITSGGSPEKVTGAKNTILYGIVGLIIVALAQVIVRFVLKQVTT